MSNDTLSNGRAGRKSLASQLDRLDGILDGLAEALNGAVADAVRHAVGSAVRDAVEEAVSTAVRAVLLHPEVRAVLASGAAPAPSRTAATVNFATAMAGRLCDAARAARKRAAVRMHGWLRGLSLAATGVLRLRKPLGLAVGVGAVVALGCYLAGPPVAAAVSGTAGFAASLAASALRTVQGAVARGASPQP